MSAGRDGEEARRALGLGVNGPVPDLLRQIEDEAGLLVFIVSLGKDGIEGALQQLGHESFVLVNQDRHPVRKRFSLAHEFGHAYLEHGSRFDQRISFSDEDLLERKANNFAAELLAPRPAVDDWFSRHSDPEVDLEAIVRLAHFFNVSAAFIRYRLTNESRLSPKKGSELDTDIHLGKHLSLARQLGLSAAQDSISVYDTHGGYVPAEMQARIGDLLRRELLTRDAAVALLRVSKNAAEEQIQVMLSTEATADETSGG